MSRKIGIMVSLVLAIIFTGAIVVTSNINLKKETKTVEVLQTTRFIPVGTEITAGDVKTVKVPEKIADNLVKNLEDVKGKVTAQSIGKNQYIFKNSVILSKPIRPGYCQLVIPTDLIKSCFVTPGEEVDLYLVVGMDEREEYELGFKETTKTIKKLLHEPIYSGAKVLRVLDSDGNDIEPVKNSSALEEISNPTGKKSIPAAIAVEVSQKRISELITYAEDERIYVVKSGEKVKPKEKDKAEEVEKTKPAG
ncbi:Flp pilus assembly protein CpaB [Desulfohalotomaculum tongense]|uniref:SAF domain-containing protein n=1 Tax=Desulforadius tongensis TaxID=1216062 RepID=UPI0019577313|nr:SAF domain-containing protein [Desulforadius tongensis]MBM7854946.1 Flp pilus assembly protein CpaB [Desulforadius tongensis]